MTIPNDQIMSPLRWEFHHFGSLDTAALFTLLEFVPISEVYLEDGIAHPDMLRQIACHGAESTTSET